MSDHKGYINWAMKFPFFFHSVYLYIQNREGQLSNEQALPPEWSSTTRFAATVSAPHHLYVLSCSSGAACLKRGQPFTYTILWSSMSVDTSDTAVGSVVPESILRCNEYGNSVSTCPIRGGNHRPEVGNLDSMNQKAFDRYRSYRRSLTTSKLPPRSTFWFSLSFFNTVS